MIELHSPRGSAPAAAAATCLVSPTDGGRIAQLTIDGQDLLVGRPEPGSATPMSWGSYPMTPWAGRVRHGRFEFDGHPYQLEINHPPHSIHGTVFHQPWSVRAADAHAVSMTCALGDHWPFGGVAHQRIELGVDHVTCVLGVTADDLAMPAQVGWHPWFAEPDDEHVSFARMYERDAEHIPTGRLVPTPPGPWDDCFVDMTAPVRLACGPFDIAITSDCSHWVVFDQLAHATCVEPQSGPPDGFNLGGSPAEFVRLEPGESLQRTMTISWTRR
ncbi:MAG: aldose epimerase [Ilumatobacteraceae bacterium]|nr:aldose epimerase [Ilumatobacteraceae bacterium]